MTRLPCSRRSTPASWAAPDRGSPHGRLSWLRVPTAPRTALVRLQPGECRLGGIETTHAVDTRPGRSGRRTEIDALDAQRVRVGRRSRTEGDLPEGVGPGADVSTDVVGVVAGELRRRPDVRLHDDVAESRREALDLGDG